MSPTRRWSDVRGELVARRIEAVDVASHDDYPAVYYATVARAYLPPLLVVHDADDGADPAGIVWLEENVTGDPGCEPTTPGHLADLSPDEAVSLGYALLAVALPAVRRRNLDRTRARLAAPDAPRVARPTATPEEDTC